ncbi:hypothetical protein RJ640_023450 [Escallonia rubra]|uniref:ENTH domain-containing protein n=1 Tax=Escallonia rubra TaxID=112253 RepID=A0AA88UL98_9ASTE|nr:hypothetical protein RJ640_023450 [Escallonia rubra]
MGRKKPVRELLGIFKDKASFIKATLSAKCTTSSVQVAVLRATTHSPTSPPPDHRITAILSLGHGTRLAACKCIQAVMHRLHGTRSAYVVLKCLITLHNIVTRGSFMLRDQLSFYPSAGGRNFLNLLTFSDKTNVESREFSSWARWYAGVLERNLITSRVLGSFFSSSSSIQNNQAHKDREILRALLNSDLVRETDALVCMVEEICRVPDTLYNQRNDLVYEAMRLVGEDYRTTQHYIMRRLGELGDRLDGLSRGESAELASCMKRLEDCKERLVEMFVNRKRNVEFWDLVSQTKMKAAKLEEERGMVLVNMGRKVGEAAPSRFGKRVVEPSQSLRLLPCGGQWLDVDRVHLTVSTAIA